MLDVKSVFFGRYESTEVYILNASIPALLRYLEGEDFDILLRVDWEHDQTYLALKS